MKITTDPVNVATQLETWLEAKKISLNHLLHIKNIINYEQLVAFCKEKNLIPCNDPFPKIVEVQPLQETNVVSLQEHTQETDDTLDLTEIVENTVPKKRKKSNNINSEE